LQAQRIAVLLRSAPARVTSEVERRCGGQAWGSRRGLGPARPARPSWRRWRGPRSTGRAAVTAVMGKTLPPKTGGR